MLDLVLTGLPNLSGLLDPDEPLPFEDLLVPFVRVFRQRIATQAAAGCDRLSAEAQPPVEGLQRRPELTHRVLR